MSFILFLLALTWVVAGTYAILRTEESRQFVREKFPMERIRAFALPVIAAGALLILWAVVHEEMFWWPFLLGVLAVAKGLLIRNRPQLVEAWLRWWTWEAPADTCRGAGLLTFSLGAALLGYLF